MLELSIALPALVNGVMAGAIYALVALGLTLIYGVLHIINFAHGNLLMVALYAVFFLLTLGGVDPYAALPIMIVGAFAVPHMPNTPKEVAQHGDASEVGRLFAGVEEIPGLTGGALDSDEGSPGPIYLQGTEAGRVAFRNIVITPAE